MSEHKTPAPEEDAALAHDLFLQGELQHGIFHLACALASDPSNQAWLSLADRYVEAADDPLALVPLEDGEKGSYFATIALRAYVLRKLGRTAEALRLLLQVNTSSPDAPFAGWTADWLEQDPAAGALIDRALLARLLGSAVRRHPGDFIEDPAAREALRPLLRVAELTIGDPDPDAPLVFVRAALLRKTGQLDAALALARRAYEAAPCFLLAGSPWKPGWPTWVSNAPRATPAACSHPIPVCLAGASAFRSGDTPGRVAGWSARPSRPIRSRPYRLPPAPCPKPSARSHGEPTAAGNGWSRRARS